VAELTVTVTGPDGPGVIAAVTGVLAELGGNLEDSSMTLLRGQFAMTLVVEVDRGPHAVEAALRPVTDPRGLLISVREVGIEAGDAPRGEHFVLRVHGGDRPGIVSAVTNVIAARGGNITDLTTRLSGQLYVLIAEVDLPENADSAALTRELATVAGTLGVEVSLESTDADVL
jgi:glycine cleavage system transcriptional repressor